MEDEKIPMAQKLAPRNIAPIYPPITGPQSKSPTKFTHIGYEIVGINIIMIKISKAKNFPITISWVWTGKVISNSYDPTLNSSDKVLIVIAGMIKDKVIGKREKKSLRFAWFITKNVEKKNHPVTNRKIDIIIYAIGDKK